MAKSNLQNRILAFLVVLSLVAPIWVLARRHSAEVKNRTVELVMDYAELQQLAGAAKRPLPDVLAQLKKAGVTSLAVQEETIGDLLTSGQAALLPQPPRATGEDPAPSETAIWVTSPEVEARIYNRLSGLGYVQLAPPDEEDSADTEPKPSEAPPAYGLYLMRTPDGGFTPLSISIDHARNVPIGLSKTAVDAAKAAGMNVVARLINYPGASGEAIKLVGDELETSGIKTVIFGQDQVLGYRGLVETTATVFRAKKLTYGSVEFAKQKGDLKLSELLEANLIRVHSIPSAEMVTLDKPTAIERYIRAARERNIRMCYLRLFDSADEDPVKANTQYVSAVASGLRSQGFKIGQAAPLSAPSVPITVLPLLGVAVALGWMLLFTSIIRPAWYYTVLLTVLWCAAGAGIAVAGGMFGRKVLALLAAVIMPTAAAIRAGGLTPACPKSAGFWSSSGKATLRLICATAVSMTGGVMAAALLSEQQFMVRVDQFAGVKLTHIAPMLLVLLAYSAGVAWNAAEWEEQKSKARQNWAKLAAEPVLVWQTCAVAVVVVLLAIAVARSGNDSGVGVSAIELKVRALMDKLLIVRPRTKEFLIGHPVMFLGIAAALLGRRKWAVPLLIFGTIGQVSVLNTFCHIHTPIATSVLRGLFGLVLGLVIGFVAYAVLRRVIMSEGNLSTAEPDAIQGGEAPAASV